MKLIAFRRFTKQTLCGLVTVELTSGLTIIDCPVHIANRRAWASLPAKPLIDRDGLQIVRDGKAQYTAALKWSNRDVADRFSDAVVALVPQQCPDALDDGDAP